MKLQTIRSRELAGDIPAVITVGFVNVGIKHNVIPDEAHIGLNIRTQRTHVQQQIVDAIRRMAEAEAQAFRAPKDPEITTSDAFPVTSNNEQIDQRVRAVHIALLGPEHIVDMPAKTSQGTVFQVTTITVGNLSRIASGFLAGYLRRDIMLLLVIPLLASFLICLLIINPTLRLTQSQHYA
jgi:metal-dependent amidase/aminoacylase/carboxypeptidase family protein